MANNVGDRFEKLFIASLDIFLIFSGFVLSYWTLNLFTPSHLDLKIQYGTVILVSLSAIIWLFLFDLFTDMQRKSSVNLIFSIVLSLTIFSLSVFLFSFIKPQAFEGSVILSAFIFQLTLILTVRLCMWSIMRRVSGKKKVLIVSRSGLEGEKLAGKFHLQQEGWFEVSGYVTIQAKETLKKYISKADIVVLSADLEKENQMSLTRMCMGEGKEVLLVPQFFEMAVFQAESQQVDDLLVFSIKPPKRNIGQNAMKRCVDFAVSLLLLIISSPIFLILYLLIPLTSKGAAIYKQERIGKNGKPFLLYKFRSMVADAEKATGPMLALDKDTRITHIGLVIRAIRIDELPQLLNVLKGDMSLVGPRPERQFFINGFLKQLPDYNQRFQVKPGITGLAQVYGSYSTSVEDKLRFDLMYVRHQSLILDLKILCQTLRVVLQPNHAKGVVQEPLKQKFGSVINS